MHRIALIGLGLAAGPHVQSLKELGGRATVTAAFSRSAARRDAFAVKTGLPVSGDLEAIFADPAIDVVAILTPPSSHLELAQRAAAAGKHILLEKPLDITTARSEALVAATESAAVVAQVMLQHRFKPSALRLARVLADGALGAIIGVSVRVPLWRPQGYYDVEGRGTRARDGGGVLLSQAIHTIDLMRSLCGPVARVCGFARDGAGHTMETEDIASAALRFDNGAIGTIDATTCVAVPSVAMISIRSRLPGLTLRWQDGRSEDLAPDNLPGGTGADPMAFSHAFHRGVWEDFLDAIDHKRAPAITPRDALATHYLIEAMLQSASKDGAPVDVRR